jgi:hypothetical protein
VATKSLVVGQVGAVPDLDTLAGTVRAEHVAVIHAAANVLHHAICAGDALIAAQEPVSKNWERWLAENCDLKLRTSQVYMQLARRRSKIETQAQHAAPLTLGGALKLLAGGQPAGPKAPGRIKPRPAGKKKTLSKFDVLEWWLDVAPFEGERCWLLDNIGRKELREALPWPIEEVRGDVGAQSTGELGRLTARVEELERELRQANLTIAGLRRQLGDDGGDAELPAYQ